ncbi:Ribbon-helix-helix protein, copG [Moorella glycerini]|uniref:Ribbon-helix-helix protein, copG family n=1 Tax=Neomoorella stamsii TaxID=1266720 RepID=A0A9X7J1L7_9FIRM|nr:MULTISPECIES: CopG family antitoxin [Moorella]PRR71675.1 Ribbon-helix-helix protein, copG family [Moorella stamsii]CEP66947.1 Ribbon-helix-helix protein, copG [Moorella glycerini]
MKKFPPNTDDLQALANFFDRTDLSELEGLEEVREKPHRSLVSVTVRLPKEDVEELKRRAARLGLGYSTLVRAAVRRFVGK